VDGSEDVTPAGTIVAEAAAAAAERFFAASMVGRTKLFNCSFSNAYKGAPEFDRAEGGIALDLLVEDAIGRFSLWNVKLGLFEAILRFNQNLTKYYGFFFKA